MEKLWSFLQKFKKLREAQEIMGYLCADGLNNEFDAVDRFANYLNNFELRDQYGFYPGKFSRMEWLNSCKALIVRF